MFVLSRAQIEKTLKLKDAETPSMQRASADHFHTLLTEVVSQALDLHSFSPEVKQRLMSVVALQLTVNRAVVLEQEGKLTPPEVQRVWTALKRQLAAKGIHDVKVGLASRSEVNSAVSRLGVLNTASVRNPSVVRIRGMAADLMKTRLNQILGEEEGRKVAETIIRNYDAAVDVYQDLFAPKYSRIDPRFP